MQTNFLAKYSIDDHNLEKAKKKNKRCWKLRKGQVYQDGREEVKMGNQTSLGRNNMESIFLNVEDLAALWTNI